MTQFITIIMVIPYTILFLIMSFSQEMADTIESESAKFRIAIYFNLKT